MWKSDTFSGTIKKILRDSRAECWNFQFHFFVKFCHFFRTVIVLTIIVLKTWNRNSKYLDIFKIDWFSLTLFSYFQVNWLLVKVQHVRIQQNFGEAQVRRAHGLLHCGQWLHEKQLRVRLPHWLLQRGGQPHGQNSYVIFYHINSSQCGNYSIFLLQRFYVKSIFENLEPRNYDFDHLGSPEILIF